MAETTTLTIRVPVDLKERLDRVAAAMKRSRSYLAAEALEHYVASELDILDGIEQSLADFEAGRFYTTAEMMAELGRLRTQEEPADTPGSHPKRGKAAA